MMIASPKKVILIAEEAETASQVALLINNNSDIQVSDHWGLPIPTNQTIDPYNTIFLFAGDPSTNQELQALAQQIPTVLLTLEGKHQLSLNDFLQFSFAGCLDITEISALKSALELCTVHFEAQKQLRKELSDVRSRLEDRKQIERAKGVLMSQHHYNESEAYVFLRKLSMDRAQRMGDVARQVLSDMSLASK